MRRRLSAILVLVLGITAAVPVLADSADAVQSTEPAAVSAADTPVDVNTEAVYLAGNPEDVAVVILHTNDAHTYYQNNIGYDGLALYKKELESQYDNVLLVDAGDTIQGTSIGTVSKGSAPVEMMNHLGYDLAVPGNHEFDFGFEVLDDCAKQLNCGYVCANFCTSDGKPVFEPWRIIESGGLKIGFVGAIIPDTFTRSAIKDIKNEAGEPVYDFMADETGDRLSENLQKYIDEVRANGADYVILVSHLGNNKKIAGVYASDLIVAKLTGLDAVIDAHSCEVYSITTPDKDGKMIPLAQAGANMKELGTLTIFKDGRLEERLIDTVPAFSKVPYETSVDLIKMYQSKDPSRAEENGLCDLVADAFRGIGDAQIGFINAGTVRSNLYKGDVTYQHIVDILPFCNTVVKAKVTGQMILDALEFGVSFLPIRDGAFPQTSGMTYTINPEIPTSVKMDELKQFISVDGERRISDVRIGDEALDPGKSYTIAMTQFLLTGGNGYTMFDGAEILTDTKLADNEVTAKYIEENLNGKIPDMYEKPLGRINWKTN